MRVISFIKYVILFALLYVSFLVYSLPAGFLWQYLKPFVEQDLRRINLQVGDIGGTVWDGQVLLKYRGSAGILMWNLSSAKVMQGQLGIDVRVTSDVGVINGSIYGGLDEQSIMLDSAHVYLKNVNPHLISQKVSLDGELDIKNVLLVLRDKKIADSIGSLRWTGGNISYPAGREVHVRDLPAFRGNIKWDEPNVLLGIRDENAGFDVITLLLEQSGWLKLNTTKRVLDLAQEPWPSSSREDQVVFSMRQKLF